MGSQGDGSAQLVCKSEADQAGEVAGAESGGFSNLAMGNPSFFFWKYFFFSGNIFFSGNTLSMDTT